MKMKIVKSGDGLAVPIPESVVEQGRLQEGDLLEIEALEDHIGLRRADQMPSPTQLTTCRC
jgi:antitoxin component of MazEF toxin-antitoxin module